MFGYVTVDIDNLKVKDYRRYESYYCGVCQDLKKAFGRKAQLTLTYDMTFLAILLTGLYEIPVKTEKHFCPGHPFHKRICLRNSCTAYAADMNLLVAYYNLLDDWEDEKKVNARIAAAVLKKSVKKVEKKYPRQRDAVENYLKKLHKAEAERSENPDLASGLTGELFAVLYTPYEDEWKEELGRIGFYIGKYIYLMDAYEDVSEDKKKGTYNPFLRMAELPDFEERAEQILTMMMAEAARSFEKLPCLEEVDILRNILYSGIWNKYGIIKKNRLNPEKKRTQEKIYDRSI